MGQFPALCTKQSIFHGTEIGRFACIDDTDMGLWRCGSVRLGEAVRRTPDPGRKRPPPATACCIRSSARPVPAPRLSAQQRIPLPQPADARARSITPTRFGFNPPPRTRAPHISVLAVAPRPSQALLQHLSSLLGGAVLDCPSHVDDFRPPGRLGTHTSGPLVRATSWRPADSNHRRSLRLHPLRLHHGVGHGARGSPAQRP